MNILIIEDDQNKINQLKFFLTSNRPNDNVIIKNSFNSGLNYILVNKIDCIILDMSMPTFDITPLEKGGSFRIYAGKDILRQMKRRGIEIPVIIVTQFDHFGPIGDRKSLSELSMELFTAYPDVYKGTVYYNPGIDNWEEDLKVLLSKFE